MKVKFNRTALQEALNLVTSIIPSKTPKPILECVRLTSEDNKVRISATDLEAGITCRISQVEVISELDIVVPAGKISSIVRESVDDVLEIEASEAAVHIRGADSHFTIYAHDVGQFPAVPDFVGEADLEIGLDKLQEAISYCVFAAAKESTRYALNGILMEIKGKKLSLVATDGRRLAKVHANLDTAGELPEGKIIVPARKLVLLEKIGGGEKSKISIKLEGNQIIFASEGVVISSNLVEGNFPKYEDIIPKDYDKKVIMSTEAALSAVRRAALLSNEDSKGVKLSLSQNSLIFSSRAPETGDAQIDMVVDYTAEPIEIGFNPQFLIDVLRILKETEFELHLGKSDRPGMIKSGNNFMYIIMPVSL